MRGLLGGLLMAIGLLIAFLSGTCLLGVFSNPSFAALMFILIGCGIGLALVFAGWSLTGGRGDR